MVNLDDIIYNTYENTVSIYGDFEMPVPTYAMDKKVDFRVLLALLLRSNKAKESNTRYVEYSRLNKKQICEECKIIDRTLHRKLKILEERGIIIPKNTNEGLTYFINCSKEGKYFVGIQHKILNYLYKHFDRNIIRVYIVLKIQCDVLKNRGSMNREYLCSILGYSTNSANNKGNIGKWTNTLWEHGLIDKVKKPIYQKNAEGKISIMRVDTYYSIKDF